MSVRGFLCLFWREIFTKGLPTRFPRRLEEDEGTQSPRAVNRKKAVNRSQGKAMVRERLLLSEELGPVDSEARSANLRG